MFMADSYRRIYNKKKSEARLLTNIFLVPAGHRLGHEDLDKSKAIRNPVHTFGTVRSSCSSLSHQITTAGKQYRCGHFN
ncbi:hypothetical protein DPMN_115184 [Dreissena polymorpha]|uniref:Uncharacterized protein n=1 Tax=Dreissena polymorpha TaxID=45954 RepID=A0A9D4QS89_DREPO|nr:hypothetical protein DPMN_115184 [Dreissena polymorpha]